MASGKVQTRPEVSVSGGHFSFQFKHTSQELGISQASHLPPCLLYKSTTNPTCLYVAVAHKLNECILLGSCVQSV